MENGFFKWVWRFNAIVIAITAVAVIGTCALIAREVWKDFKRGLNTRQVVNIDTLDTSLKEEFAYGQPQLSDDGKSLIMPLKISQKYEFSQEYLSSGLSKSTGRNTINHLIVSRKDGSHRWLFPSNTQLITSWHLVTRPVDAEHEDKITVVRLYVIVTADTNNDKRLSDSDIKTLIMTGPDRTAPTELIGSFDRMVSILHPDDATFEVVIEQDGAYVLHRFSIASKQKIGQIELPALPTSRQ